MNIPGSKTLCEQAKLYYQDLLSAQDLETVPSNISGHVEQCPYCRQQMDVLRRVQSSTAVNEPGNAEAVAAMTDILSLHLAYADKQVTCETIKSFLPSLVIPALEVKIPTPITVHLDKCGQCADDFEKIRHMNLTRGQLYRLSDFLAEEHHSCSYVSHDRAKAARRVANLNWQGIETDILKHLCKCEFCREVVYEERKKILENLPRDNKPGQYPCEELSTSGIFDYVLPYGLDAEDDQYERFRWPFISHVVKCKDCLSRMQQLHRDLCQIDERPDSGVVTIFRSAGPRRAETLDKADRLYAGFPIRVETVSGSEPVVESAASAESLPNPTVVNFTETKQKTGRFNLSYDAKASIVAAALIVIGISIFFYKPAVARLTPLDKMQHAMQKTSNVHTAQFVPGKNEPVFEQWVSKTLGILKTTNKNESILYDTHNKIIKTKRLGTNTAVISPLSAEDLARIEKTIAGHFGLTSVAESTLNRKGVEWSRIADDDSLTSGIEAYGITYSKKDANGSDTLHKWLVFANRDTFLPVRTEFYDKPPTDEEYILISTQVFEYLSDSEMQAVVDGF